MHVSQLKKHIASDLQVSTDLTTIPDADSAAPQPIAVLDSRLVSRGSSTVTELLIHWSGLSPTLVTWEECQDFYRRYKSVPACGQDGFRGGDSVMSRA